ncbi:hypothetical protein ACHAWF_009104 [Thalassiosira exigua]
MSLLALMADKFELEQPDAGAPVGRRVDEGGDDAGLAFSSLELRGDGSPSAEERAREPADDGSPSIASEGKGAFVGLDGPGSGGGAAEDKSSQQETKLLVTFLLMVIVGTANKVFQKLQAIPMYNYPNSLNLLQNFVYVPLCFAYILPVSRFGLLNNAIPAEVTVTSKKPFAVMGLLDCLTCTLLTFASVYLPGSLLILLPQASIPASMILSKRIKGETYAKYQYLGAAVVVAGILVVLEPLMTQRHASEFQCEAYDQDEFCALCEEETTEDGCLSHRTNAGHFESAFGSSFVVRSWTDDADGRVILRSLAESNSSTSQPDMGELCRWMPSTSAQQQSSGSSATTTLIWSIVTILACIPMALSSIYKELALSGSQTDLDPIFLNGWVALFQLMFSFPLSIPAGIAQTPPVAPRDLPQNIWDGIKCYLGMGTIHTGCHPDDKCSEAPLYVNVFLVFNVCFNILIVYILK